MKPDAVIARRTFRAWVRAEQLTSRRLAGMLGVPLWRAKQLACGRLRITEVELARMGTLAHSYLGMLRRELQD